MAKRPMTYEDLCGVTNNAVFIRECAVTIYNAYEEFSESGEDIEDIDEFLAKIDDVVAALPRNVERMREGSQRYSKEINSGDYTYRVETVDGKAVFRSQDYDEALAFKKRYQRNNPSTIPKIVCSVKAQGRVGSIQKSSSRKPTSRRR